MSMKIKKKWTETYRLQYAVRYERKVHLQSEIRTSAEK